jgi:hypothetical protein
MKLRSEAYLFTFREHWVSILVMLSLWALALAMPHRCSAFHSGAKQER